MISRPRAAAVVLVSSLLVASVGCAHHGPGERYVDAEKLAGPPPAEAAPSDCADDAREEDDSPVDVIGTIVTGLRPIVWKDQVSCPGDDDLVHGFSDGTGQAGATVTWKGDLGDLRVDLLDAQGRPVKLNGMGMVDRQPGRVEVKVAIRGDFYVRIRNLAGTRVPYEIEIVAPSPGG